MAKKIAFALAGAAAAAALTYGARKSGLTRKITISIKRHKPARAGH